MSFRILSIDGLKIWLLAACGFMWTAHAAAQELTPRSFWPAPKGTKVVVAAYSYSSGDVLYDHSVPIVGANSESNVGLLAYLQTLDLGGRTSNLLVELPYSWGTSEGEVGATEARTAFSDFGDLAVTLNLNLRGAPTMNRDEFLALRADPHMILGASLKVVAPTGRYDPDRLVNVGLNRWALRAQLGTIMPIKPTWLLEMTAGAWFFGDDEEFIAGTKEQAPVISLQTNLIKRIRPGFWASLDLTYFMGGRQTIGGNQLEDKQSNTKIGGTIVFPFLGRHAVKLGYANGISTRYGGDFEQLLVTYQAAF